MALLFMDGFDANDLVVKWDGDPGLLARTSPVRFSGRSVTADLGTRTMYKNLPASNQLILGCAVYMTSAGTISWDFYGDNGTTVHVRITYNGTTQKIHAYRGAGTTLLATSTPTYALNAWHCLEVSVTVNDTTGNVTVRMDTVEIINFTGDTKNAGTATTLDRILLTSSVPSITDASAVDDLYVLDATGGANNSFLGDVRVSVLSPSGNGTSSQLVGSDSDSVNNYLLVDEIPYSSADYVGSATIGERDIYTFSDLPANITTVYAVQNNLIAAKNNAGTANAIPLLRVGGTTYSGPSYPLLTSYLNYRYAYDINPNTSVQWTVGDVNGLEAGMEVA